MNLRPYQSECERRVFERFAGEDRSTLIVLPTGCGKTVVFATIAGKAVSLWPGKRVLILAHREELIHQAVEKVHAVTGIKSDIEMADYKSERSGMFRSEVIVASVQTMLHRFKKFKPADFGLIVIDEAHHAEAQSYRKIVAYFQEGNPTLRVLGVTATPDRFDKKALKTFQSVAFEMSVLDAVTGGWLVPIEQKYVAVESLDFSKMRTTAGDLNGADLAAVMEYEKTLHEVVDPTIEIVGRRRSLVFAASVAHAERMAEIFNRHRPACARIVTGTTPSDERRDLFREYKEGGFQYLVNVQVATEGFDDPGIEVVVMARPTESRSLYAQMLGRGTRSLPGLIDGIDDADARRFAIEMSRKPRMTVLDFVGNAGKHKLVHAVDIVGKQADAEAVEKAKQLMLPGKARAAGVAVPRDVADALDIAKSILAREKAKKDEAERRKALRAKATFSTENISPFDVLGITPNRSNLFAAHDTPATHKQVETLRNAGIPNPERMSQGEASKIIDEIRHRFAAKKCTFKQARILREHGFDTSVSMREASQIITGIQANRGRGRAKIEVAA